MRDDLYYANLEFLDNQSKVHAYYKAHLQSVDEISPTHGNSQRRITQTSGLTSGTSIYHFVYESNGRIYYTWSIDDAGTWEPEVLISEFNHTCKHPTISSSKENQDDLAYTIYIAYSDLKDSTVVIKRNKYFIDHPDNWFTIDAVGVNDPASTHASLESRLFDSHPLKGDNLTIMVWESEKDIRYSIYRGDEALSATRNGSASRMDFRDLLLCSGTTYVSGMQLAPQYPTLSIERHVHSSDMTASIIWTESPYGVLKQCALHITEPLGVDVEDNVMSPIGNGLPVRDNTGASSIYGDLADLYLTYEYDNITSWPIPTQSQSWPITALGRHVWPITQRYYGYSIQQSVGIPEHVVVRYADNGVWNKEWTVLCPWTSLYSPVRAPSVGYGRNLGTPVRVAYNTMYNNQPAIAVVNLHKNDNFLSPPGPGLFNNLIYGSYDPTLCGTSVDLYYQICLYSRSIDRPSPVSGSSEVAGLNIRHEIDQNTSYFRKIEEEYISGRMKQLYLWNDSGSLSIYGILGPSVTDSTGAYVILDWEEADTAILRFWSQIPDKIRTEVFTVPEKSVFEFANELYAVRPDEMGSSLRIAVEFRRGADNELLRTIPSDKSLFCFDSSIYGNL